MHIVNLSHASSHHVASPMVMLGGLSPAVSCCSWQAWCSKQIEPILITFLTIIKALTAEESPLSVKSLQPSRLHYSC